MPYTFSHPVIVLPLKRLKSEWFSTTGLVAGSIAPDLPYFVMMDATTNIGHTWYGAFLVDLPAAFLVALAFHLGIRNLLIKHLPYPLDKKFANCLSFNFCAYMQRKWGIILVSTLIGIWSHLAWDNFASSDGWIYYLQPSFFEQTVTVGSLEYHVYRLIERIESLAGLGLLGWIILRKRSTKLDLPSLPSRKKVFYWASLLLITGLISLLYVTIDSEEVIFAHMVVVITSAALASLIVTSAVVGVLSIAEKQKV